MKNKKAILLLSFIGCLFLLSSCDTTNLGESFKTSIIDALVPNFWAFLTQFLALIVLIVLVSVFAYKPIRNYLDKRSEYLANEVKDANKNNALSKMKLEEAERKIAESKKEAANIIDNAKNEANIERKKILDKTNEDIIKLKAKSEEDITLQEEKAQKDIERSIVSIALDASKQVLSREVNEDDNKKIVEDFVSTLNESNSKNEVK